jgi:hypothetical protein
MTITGKRDVRFCETTEWPSSQKTNSPAASPNDENMTVTNTAAL